MSEHVGYGYILYIYIVGGLDLFGRLACLFLKYLFGKDCTSYIIDGSGWFQSPSRCGWV